MTPEAETILLNKLTAVLHDLRETGASDGESMFMLGAGADHLCSSVEAPTWPAFKAGLDTRAMAGLLAQIDAEGQQAVAGGQPKHAYALQALGLSLAATASQNDTIRTAAGLVDDVIQQAFANYRRHAGAKTSLN